MIRKAVLPFLFLSTPGMGMDVEGIFSSGAHLGEAMAYVRACPYAVQPTTVSTFLTGVSLLDPESKDLFQAGFNVGMGVAFKLTEQARIGKVSICDYAYRRYGPEGSEVPGLLKSVNK